MTAATPTAYGNRKAFQTPAGTFHVATKAEAAKLAKCELRDVQGPALTDALRGEPQGNRRHPEVTYLGVRAVVRALNRAA